ncbi:MAG: aminopeptidase N [Planctomycetota bacterium]|jgi:aminopeptidase N
MINSLFRLTTILLVSVGLGGCIHDATHNSLNMDDAVVASELDEGISAPLAKSRAARVSNLSYRLSLSIDPKADSFTGLSQMDFDLTGTASDLIIDFRGKAIIALRVNAKPIKFAHIANHLVVPRASLQKGRNEIVIEYEAGIGAAGEGLIRVEDKDDSSNYLYTLNVPADAHRVFPCFDQPDLKARFKLSVSLLKTPGDYRVISNVPIEGAKKSTNPNRLHGNAIFKFKQTQLISTYLFAFAVGPFASLTNKSFGRPMTFYGRRSQRELMEKHADEVFKLHGNALKFLEGWFNVPYPFEQFDFVCVPDFPFSGMEHPGCIFYGEDPLLFRSAVSELRKTRRADLIAHETAHMWFGDLVTMPWFDDVWLKEGYATFMAHKTLENIVVGTDHDSAFFLKNYPSAIATDATAGSTPMRQPLRNMDDAKSNYGPIIYSKGPAVLRALEYMIGEDAFRRGSKLFLDRHAFACGSWTELRHALEDAWGKGRDSLADFGVAWIEEAGVPDVTSSIKDDANGKKIVQVNQRDASGQGRVWPLAVEACYYDQHGQLQSEKISFNKLTASIEKSDVATSFSFANYKNRAYARFLLDESALKHVMAHFEDFIDPLLRSMLWESVWSAVEEGQLRPDDYLEFVHEYFFRETDQRLLSLGFGRISSVLSRYMSGEEQMAYSQQIEDDIILVINGKHKSPGTLLLMLRRFISIARSEKGLGVLVSLAEGNYTDGDIEISKRDRWNAVTRLMLMGDKRADSLLGLMTSIEDGDEARRRIFMVECARGDEESKAEIFRRFFHEQDLPERWVQDGAAVFFAPEQAPLTNRFLPEALDQLEWIKKNRKIFFLAAWVNAAIKSRLDENAVTEVEDYLSRPGIPNDIRSKVLVPLHHLKQTIQVRRGSH